MEFTIIAMLVVGAGAIGSGVSIFLSRKVIRAIRQDKSLPKLWLLVLGSVFAGVISWPAGLVATVYAKVALERFFSFYIPFDLSGALFFSCITAACAGLLTWLVLKAIEFEVNVWEHLRKKKTPPG